MLVQPDNATPINSAAAVTTAAIAARMAADTGVVTAVEPRAKNAQFSDRPPARVPQSDCLLILVSTIAEESTFCAMASCFDPARAIAIRALRAIARMQLKMRGRIIRTSDFATVAGWIVASARDLPAARIADCPTSVRVKAVTPTRVDTVLRRDCDFGAAARLRAIVRDGIDHALAWLGLVYGYEGRRALRHRVSRAIDSRRRDLRLAALAQGYC
jgi:hypothetical protein